MVFDRVKIRIQNLGYYNLPKKFEWRSLTRNNVNDVQDVKCIIYIKLCRACLDKLNSF